MCMAKSDSFIIRAKTDTDGTTYAQTAIDLGSYVDALGKSVLRIHKVEVQYGGPLEVISGGVNTATSTNFQLTTQSQAALVDATDRSLIASGNCTFFTGGTAVENIQQHLDMGPESWRNGYLIGVEQIYLGVDQQFDHVSQVSVVMECTVETLSQSAAMSLALSQQ